MYLDMFAVFGELGWLLVLLIGFLCSDGELHGALTDISVFEVVFLMGFCAEFQTTGEVFGAVEQISV
jgi:hypothetical protein